MNSPMSHKTGLLAAGAVLSLAGGVGGGTPYEKPSNFDSTFDNERYQTVSGGKFSKTAKDKPTQRRRARNKMARKSRKRNRR